MTRAMKVLLAAAVATCGACGKTLPTSPVVCTAKNSRQVDTLYFANMTPPKIELIIYSGCQ